MPASVTITAAPQVLPSLALSTSEDTYTITAGRAFSEAAPLVIRIVADTAGALIGLVSGGPYYLNPGTWSNPYKFTMKEGEQKVLYFKATSGTPTVYLMTVDCDD